jgi:MFS family permease
LQAIWDLYFFWKIEECQSLNILTSARTIKVNCLMLKKPILALLVLCVLSLNFLFAVPLVGAQQTIFSDDFTKDKSLDANVWVRNGNLGYNVYKAVESAVLSGGGPYLTLVDSTPAFSSSGMSISAANEQFTMTTVESVYSFSAPFVLRANVSASQGGGAAFAIWLNGQVGFSACLNPTGSKYGIWCDNPGKWFSEKLVASPKLNTIYDLSISVDSSGLPTLTVNSGGLTLGSTVGLSLSNPSSVKILIGQYEFWEQDTGIGTNQAYWKTITVTGPQGQTGQPNVSNSPNPSGSTTTPSTITPSETRQPDQSGSPSPSTTISPTCILTLSPNASNPNETTEPVFSSLPFGVIIIIIAIIPASLIIAFLAFKIKKRNQQKENVETRSPKSPRNWLLLPLMIASFSTGVSNGIVGLYAADIARTFFGTVTSNSIGLTTQLSTINNAFVVIATIAISVLVIRFRHKSLFLVGGGLILVSAIGGYLAPNLLSLQFFYALEGVGSAIIGIISAVLIVESISPEKRGKTISALFAVGALVTLIITPILNYITEIGDWRSGLIFLTLPISLIGLILSALMVPNKPIELDRSPKPNPYIDAFKTIIKNRSGLFCVIANLFTVAGTEVAIFAIAFYRVQFNAPRATTMLISEIALILFFIAPLVSGLFIDKFGAKKVALVTTFLAAVCTLTFFFIPILWLTVTIDMTHVWFAGMAQPAFAMLVLKQTPKFMGTMFSINSLFNYVGKVIAPALSGVLLIVSSGMYGTIGLVLGGMTVIGCLIILLLVKETKQL